MKKFKKILAMGMTIIAMVSAMCINVTADEIYGTVDSLDELYIPIQSFEVDENGNVVILDSDGEINPYGLAIPPTPVAGSTSIYFYTTTGQSGVNGSYYTNMDAQFNFNFTSSATTSTAQYAEFLVAATSTSKNIYFKASGGDNKSVNISLLPVNDNGQVIGPKTLSVTASGSQVSFNGLVEGAIYAIKITPRQSGSMSGTVNMSDSAF